MIEQLSDILRFSAIFLLIIFIMSIWRCEAPSFKKNILIGFLIANISILLNYWEPVVNNSILFDVFLFTSVMFPILFWLLSNVFFDDDFKWSSKYKWIAVISQLLIYLLYRLNGIVDYEWYTYFKVLPYLITSFFILMVIYESLKDREADLVNIRLRFRILFVVFSAVISLMSVFFFFTENPVQLPVSLELTKNIIMIVFLILFFYNQIELKPIFKTNVNPKKQDVEKQQYDDIIKKIEQEFKQNMLFKKEGLTISVLSDVINEKEYMVRKAINGNLGYRNFNGFINYYRIKEACRILKTEKKRYTFQEIAYSLGYQSVATFNRAFKSETGVTPSAFLLDDSSSSKISSSQ